MEIKQWERKIINETDKIIDQKHSTMQDLVLDFMETREIAVNSDRAHSTIGLKFFLQGVDCVCW